MSSTPFPKSDVEVPSARLMANRKSLRSSSLRRSDSFGADAVDADDTITREDGDGPGNSSRRLSAALADEREETRIRLTKELEAEEEPPDAPDSDIDDVDEGDSEGGQRTIMSLMDLLEETDRKAGVEGPNYRFHGDEGEAEEEEEEEEEEGGKEVNCCVCRVKHRGNVLPLCGHSYCRMCSRDMVIQKGHCPACTNFVLEILEIF